MQKCSSLLGAVVILVLLLSALLLYTNRRSQALIDASRFNEEADETRRIKVITRRDLSESKSRLLLSIVNHVFDVSKGAAFYGKDGHYAGFVGRDATRAFATGEFDEEELSESVDGLSALECQSVLEWLGFYKKNAKYTFVGYLEEGMYIDTYFDEKADRMRYREGAHYRALTQCAAGSDTSPQEQEAGNCRSRYEFRTKIQSRWCESDSTNSNSHFVPRRMLTHSSSGALLERCVCLLYWQAHERRDISLFPGCDEHASHCDYEGELGGEEL